MITAISFIAGAFCFFAGYILGYCFTGMTEKKKSRHSCRRFGEVFCTDYKNFLDYDGTENTVNS